MEPLASIHLRPHRFVGVSEVPCDLRGTALLNEGLEGGAHKGIDIPR